MQRRKDFKFIAKIDITMGYTFEIENSFQKLHVINTPLSLYQYKRLPMGITNRADFFQPVMHPLFADIKLLPNKVIGITKLARPSSTKEIRSFIGLVNY